MIFDLDSSVSCSKKISKLVCLVLCPIGMNLWLSIRCSLKIKNKWTKAEAHTA